MSGDRGIGGLPPGHIVARVSLGCVALLLLVTAALLAYRQRAPELAFGGHIWAAMKNWAVPW